MKLKVNYIDEEAEKAYNCIVNNENIQTREDRERVRKKIEKVVKKRIKIINWKLIEF